MNIGILFYSNTGNTLSVAERLAEALKAKGHPTTLEKIVIAPDDPNVQDSVLISAPSFAKYDRVVLASPVHGFMMSRAMKLFLEQAPDFAGKKVACFVTHFFPFAWMGGRGTVKKIAQTAASKGATVVATGVVDWKNKKREQEIETLISTFVTSLA